ncbi:MAG TPA: 4-alpha-glucanotransferase, partial [Methylomirabilota bacterium]|nr:4-alpha-glucanotransferase [Methylomirabilota bacterium]
TRAAILAAMGAEASRTAPPTGRRVRVVRARQTARVSGPAELHLEEGGAVRVEGALPPDLPFGYHELRPLDGGPAVRLIVSPDRCHLPPRLRTWGWAVQLYAARSAGSWGIGDLADLRRLAEWSARELGAGLLLVNPLQASNPVTPQEASPYYPSSRRYRNPLYLRIEDVPGAAEARLGLARLAAAGRALNEVRRIDRDAIFRLKMEALDGLWSRFGGDPAFDRYRAAEGEPLAEFATFCALAERCGPNWRRWPAEYRRPDAPGVPRFRAEHAERLEFHRWLQWLLDAQLARASGELAVMHDLPIGVDPGGADAWAWQDVLTIDVTVGAPPDRFNTQGQDWALPPFVPHRLAAAGYEPFVQTIRAALRHAGGLRIDHVMGLFRLFWIPKGMRPAEGAFVRYPADDLLGIVALESHRAGAMIVGEDLGTVEKGVRERLASHGILSYRVLWFEENPPSRFPELALGAVTTHDLPTVAGLWTGADLRNQRDVGLHPNEEGTRGVRARLRALTGLPDDAPTEEVIERTYRLLGQAPSAILTATLEDACAVDERPNMPGTFTEWPNWALALPMALETLERQLLPHAIAAALRRPTGS